ncbi:MAG: DNA mismatch repair endonuclease MutL [Proteobacteria bacterium]|nr:DNA mismatch repair endonuclease MutL [Pseudomonadota bacterium]MBU1060840.1 DNA mismatch repair endonuclease MutL [Pseudomonadota bacterium]
MSKIRVLPEQLANRIAAGEVVERPASVVKELIENSLDAGAERIEVEIEGGGTRLIRVIDNGEGMDEDDVLLCLERHGTSKISVDQDLDEIKSLGFRGEAIPSIASVSRMTISSRLQSAELGTTAILNYGQLTKIHETGCARGTIIEIRNLFGNTPARRKFLRTQRTELGHIDEVIKNYALAAAKVSFVLRVDGRETLHLDSSQSLTDRLAAIMHYSGDFIEINHSEPGTSLPQLRGYLVPPDHPIQGSARIRILVNGRSVKDRMLTHGVTEGLRGFLMKGKNPAGLIHLLLSPADVDVNVHPTKQEVRFRRSRDIHQLIVQAIQQALHGYQQTLKKSFFSSSAPAQPERARTENAQLHKPDAKNTAQNSFSWETKKSQQPPPPLQTAVETNQEQKRNPSSSVVLQPAPPTTAEPIAAPERAMGKKLNSSQPVFADPGRKNHGLQVVGQFANLYIFCQSGSGLVVIDQHAAHERLLFEELKQQFLRNGIVRQTLLFPETVELSVDDIHKVEQYGDTIDKMGFTIREFGGSSYVVSAVPALGGHSSPTDLFLDLLEQFNSSNTASRKGSMLEDILASMACKAAVKAGDPLTLPEIEALLDKMARADLFSHCPHGRPVLKAFSESDIKKWFHRP